MFVNIKAFAGGNLTYQVNPYDYTVGTLKGLPNSSSSPSLGPNEVYVGKLVYEMHPSSTLTGEDETFHFALATGRYKDNRIPPKGFDIASAAARLSVPVWLCWPGVSTSRYLPDRLWKYRSNRRLRCHKQPSQLTTNVQIPMSNKTISKYIYPLCILRFARRTPLGTFDIGL